MGKDYREINNGSRTALVKSSNLYGGQILTVKATAPEDAVYSFGFNIYENPYTIAAEVTSNGNGEGGKVLLTFYAQRGDDRDGYYYWIFDSMSGDFNIGKETYEKNPGVFSYNVGEEIYVDMTQFSQDNSGLDITGIVTSIYPDRNYGYAFNHQILYDRYDRKMYVKIINDDGSEEVIDFNGNPYVPTELPDETSFINYKRISSTEILFTYNNFPTKVLDASVYRDELTVKKSEILESSIKLTTEENIEYGRNYIFYLTFIDSLGKTIEDEVTINIEDPGGTGDNWGFGSYIAWTGTPYFLDESYHMAVYTYDDLVNMGLNQGSGVISRIGFPFHLVQGQGDNLSNEEIEDGSFLLAASIIDYSDKREIRSEDVINSFLIDDEFNTSVLDINKKVPGIVETYNGQRYVFFQIDNFHWNFSSNILITYWMDGPQPASGGWNGGYITSGTGVQEVLGFSKASNWVGTDGIDGEKVALAFTTLRQ
jgi:hypothetical protein